MKNIYLLALFLISLTVFPQGVPQSINYQGVARNVLGQPITTPISVKVDIHQGSSNGGVVCSEIFPNVSPNTFGVFALQIGTVSPAQFSAITWSMGAFYIGVSIDPNNGTSFGTEVSNQRLMSVPYALYAERTGGSGPTTTITSTYPSIISVNSAAPSHTINYTPPQLTLTSDTVLQIVQGAHTSSAVIIKSGVPTSTATGPWTKVLNDVFLLAPLSNVGIGTSSPAAKLEVSANPLSTNNAIGAYAQGGNGILAITSSTNVLNSAVMASNSGAGSGIVGSTGSTLNTVAGVIGQNTGVGPGLIGSNMNSSPSSLAFGVYGETNSQNLGVAGVTGVNSGAGAGVLGTTSSSNISVSAVKGQNSGSGAGVYGLNSTFSSSLGANGVKGESNSSNFGTAGVYGIHFGDGAGVYGINSASTSSSFAHGVYGRTGSTSAQAAGVHGLNASVGAGVKGINTLTTSSGNAHGLHGEANSSAVSAYGAYGLNNGGGSGVYGRATSSLNINAYGVYGQNIGVGAGVFGANTISANNPNAHGVNGLTNSTNTLAAGVLAENQGNGPALKAVSGTGSSVAILVDNGHIKATGPNPATTITFSNVTTGTLAIIPNLSNNDVRGVVVVNSNVTGTGPGTYFEVTVGFTKFYQTAPTVVVSQYDQSNFTHTVSQIFNTHFIVRIANKTATSLGASQFKFSYIVIE